MSALMSSDFHNHSRALPATSVFEWSLDLAKHASLINQCTKITSNQIDLMEQLRQAKLDTPEDQTDPTLESLNRKLNGLERDLSSLRQEMYRIETRALTHVPENRTEAKMLLAFISSTLQVGHSIDASYLADVLASCTEAFSAEPGKQLAWA